MQHRFPSRAQAPGGRHAAFGTLILAAAVGLSACHAAPPPGSGFVSTSADKAREAQLQSRLPPMKPLQPFDEGFVVVDDPDATP